VVQDGLAFFHERMRYTSVTLLPSDAKGREHISMPAKAARELDSEIERRSPEDFPALEAKIYKAIELLKAAKAGQAAAERDVQRLRRQLEEREEELETLRSENVSLRKDREEVRGRVERMLKQIDALVTEG
jgi:chromosome segregation ATPase